MRKKISKTLSKLRKEQKRTRAYRKKVHWMQLTIVSLVIFLLLLIFALGYATDWTRGLRKDSSIGKVELSEKAESGQNGGGGQTTVTGGGGTTKETLRTVERNSASNTSESTSTTNNSDNTSTSASEDALLNLYAGSSVGDTIDDLLSQANSLGIDVSCEEGLLLQECVFSAGELSFSTKNILGTGLITSVLSNL